jgi:hypothetical protein
MNALEKAKDGWQSFDDYEKALAADRELKELEAQIVQYVSLTSEGKTEQVPVAYLCENAVGFKYFRRKQPDSIYRPIPLYRRP